MLHDNFLFMGVFKPHGTVSILPDGLYNLLHEIIDPWSPYFSYLRHS